jgi:hypothetical protein
MMALLAVVGWILFSVFAAVIARVLAVKFAEKRGYSALTMPMSYHVGFITIYLILVYSTWLAIHFTVLA